MDLDQLVSNVKQEGVSLGAPNGKLLVIDPSSRLPEILRRELDQQEGALVQLFARKSRKQQAYWKRTIGEQFAATPLIESRTMADPGASGNGALQLLLDGPALARLRGTIAGICSLETLLCTAWAILLARYSGESQVGYFTAVSSRAVGLNGIADMKGLIFNLRPLTAALPGDGNLRELLGQSEARRRQDAEYEFPAFADGNKFAGKTYPFDTLLVIDKAGEAPTGCEICSMANLEPLHLKAIMQVLDDQARSRLCMELQYPREYLADKAAHALLQHFETTINSIIDVMTQGAAGTACLGDLDMLSAAQRQALLDLGSGGKGAPVDASCIHELVERAASRTPDATAIICRGHAVSYAELNRKANQLAHQLLDMRSGPGTVIGICMARSPELVIAMLAVLKAGCAYVPLDPNYPASRLDFMLADSGSGLVVANAEFADRLSALGRHVVIYDGNEGGTSELADSNIPIETAGTSAASLAYVIYTSGSTGLPKGVMIEHRATVSFLQWARNQFSEPELRSMLCSTSICFDLSIFEIFLPLSIGTRLVLVDTILELFNGDPIPDISMINSVPSAVAELIESNTIPESVLTVCLAGEPLRRKLVSRIFEQSTVGAVYNLYGPSEYTTYTTFTRLMRDDTREPSIGRPVADTYLYVLDADGKLVPEGVKGELFVGGSNISCGYINRAELTSEKFLADPFFPGSGKTVYRTGDFVRWTTGGNLEFAGRRDEQIKLRGFRIELGEIEARLIAIDSVENAAVLVREGEDGEKRLVAYVAAEALAGDDAGAAHNALRESLKQQLGAALPAHMVPEIYVFMPSLPLTLNGKIDRKQLPAPGQDDLRSTQYVAPRTDIERELCGYFQNLLGLAQVGVNDDFFALGGHSLLVFRLLILMRRSFKIDMPLKTLFECPTVALLSERVRVTSENKTTLPLIRCDRTSRLAASFAQQRFWFLYKLDENSPEYNLPLFFKLQGKLDMQAFRRAVDALVARHEVLRTVLQEDADGIVQRIADAAQAPFDIADLSHLEPDRALAAAREYFDGDLNTPFRLDTQIPVRFLCARINDSLHHVLFNVHHVAFDGGSINVMQRDFCALYEAFAAEKEHGLPALSVQYADYAVWQRKCLDEKAMADLRERWKRTMENAPRLHSLPLDRPRPAQQRPIGRGMKRRIDKALFAEFKTLCASQGATLFMGLQTLYSALLGRWSNHHDIVMGTPVAGRTVAGTEPLIGCFVNNVTLRSQVNPDSCFVDLLNNNKSMILHAIEGQQFPFEALVAECEVRRDPSHQPIFQVWFVLQSKGSTYPAIEGLEVRPIEAHTVAENIVHFDLSLTATEAPDQLDLLWEFQHDLFDHATIDWLATCFETLLAAALKAPNAQFLRLPLALLPAGAGPVVTVADEVIASRAAGAATTPAMASALREPVGILKCVADSVARAPDAIALTDGAVAISYQELDARSDRVAAYLVAHGVVQDAMLLVQLDSGIDRIIALLAIIKCGAAYTLLDERFDAAELTGLFRSGAVSGLVCRIAAGVGAVGALRRWPIDEALAWEGLPQPAATTGIGALLRVGYIVTSTAGQAAIDTVTVDAALVLQHLEAQAHTCGITGASRMLILPQTLHFAPFEWMLGLVVGAHLQLAEHTNVSPPPSHMTLTPGLLAGIDETLADSVSSVLLTGDSCASWNAWQWAAKCKVFNAFGSRELPFVTCEQVVVGQEVTLGVPTCGDGILLLDSHGFPTPAGMPAELHLDLSHASNSWNACGALLRRRHDGKYLSAGVREVVRIRGFDLNLSDIEARIALHADVADVMLQIAGDGRNARLVAMIATRLGRGQRQALLASLKETLQSGLPPYQQPDMFVALDSLPLTPAGQRDRGFLGNCRALWMDRIGMLQSLGLSVRDARNEGWTLRASPAGESAEIHTSMPRGRLIGRYQEEVLFLSAFVMLMAHEFGQAALCVSAASMGDATPVVLGAGPWLAQAGAMACEVADGTTLQDIAVELGERLSQQTHHALLPYLQHFDVDGGQDYGRLHRAAQCQFLFTPEGCDEDAANDVAACAPIRLELKRHGGQLSMRWCYSEEQFTAEKVGALSRRFQRLLSLLQDDADATFATIRHRLEADVKAKIMDLKSRFK